MVAKCKSATAGFAPGLIFAELAAVFAPLTTQRSRTDRFTDRFTDFGLSSCERG